MYLSNLFTQAKMYVSLRFFINFQGQIQELKQPHTPSATQLQSMLIDPAVNILFEKMKSEVTETKDKLEQAQNDLSAWKFTPDR